MKNKLFLKHWKNRLLIIATVIGPGCIVMLADTDVGSLVAASQSGAMFGYKMLIVQLVLIPVLYVTQELTVRLGIVTGKGQGELIKKTFGKAWSIFVVSALVLCCIFAIISEMSGIASVGFLYGVPSWLSMLLSFIFLAWMAWTKSYFSFERIALGIGAFELVYILIAWLSHPDFVELKQAFSNLPIKDPNYLYLLAANIGAVIMPWMIFYQQSAVVDKGLKLKHLKIARAETFVGAIITQLIMISVLVATAATIGKTNPGASLETVQQISDAFVPFLGITVGRVLFSLGMLGASLVATIVVSLTCAWCIGEITGFKRSLQDHPKEAPWFYTVYLVILLIGGSVVIFAKHLVHLNIAVEVLNALLLPIILIFLFLLARKLPQEYRIKGWYSALVFVILFVTAMVGFGAGLWGIVKQI